MKIASIVATSPTDSDQRRACSVHLERSIKLTNEPPQGLKQNLKRAFARFEKDEFEPKDPKVKSIIFGLCHFHSMFNKV